MGKKRLAVDVGGTFTDLVLLDETSGEVAIEKEPSQIGEITDHLFRACERLGVGIDALNRILHASTVAINTVLQGRGAKIGVITTAGFRDVLELGRGNRPEVYNLLYKPPPPLVPRHLRHEVAERMSHKGQVLVPLDEDGVRRAARALGARGVEAVAICFLHAYANPRHEQRARAVVEETLPGVPVAIASEITGEWREFERSTTVALNAYVMPRMQAYVGELAGRLDEVGFGGALNIIQSTGGMLSAEESQRVPIRTLESGPAGGVIGTVALGRLIGREQLIAADVGGTSFDVGLVVDGRPLEASQTTVDRRPVLVPSIDIVSVGAGGGSIAWIDGAGGFRVGPQSAEADPGPVCFGRGGTAPTVTDAHVVLGRINPANFLGRRMQLDVEAARDAIRSAIAEPLGLDVDAAAHGITLLADTNMIHAIRRVTIERGRDPRELSLLAYGGGGGLFAAALAEELRIREAIVPVHPAVFSAWGILNADYREDLVRTDVTTTAELDADGLIARLEKVATDCLAQLAKAGMDASRATTLRSVDMRYDGQEHTVAVAVPADEELRADGLAALVARFEALHERTFGHKTPEHPTEIVNLRVTASLAVTKPKLSPIATGSGDARPAFEGTRPVYFAQAQGFVDTAIYARQRLGAGDRLAGPAIVEEWNSTTIVPPGRRLEVDTYGNLLLAEGEAP